MPPRDKEESVQTRAAASSGAREGVHKVDSDQKWVQAAIVENGWKQEWGQLGKRRVSERLDIRK